jgi:type I restriction enzyme S subunit
MSKIYDLIAQYCPNGVEFRKLGDIVKTITTGKLNANLMVENGMYPFFTCDATPFQIDNYAFDTEAIIISGNGSQVGHINYYNGKFNAYQRTYIISDCNQNLAIHYLLFYLKCYLRAYIIRNSRKGSVPYITMPMIHNFEIPLPPLPVQQEIVKD